MEYLMYTKGDGKVSSLPLTNNKAVEGIKTPVQWRQFLGDEGAVNFKILQESDLVPSPVWDSKAKTYVEDVSYSVGQSAMLLSRELESLTVKVPANEIQPEREVRTRPQDFFYINEALLDLPDGESILWHQGSKVFPLTKEELQFVSVEGKRAIKEAHSRHIERISPV